MGYSTNFTGDLSLSRPATDVEKNYINTFSGTRRMKRDVNKLMELFKGKHGHPTPKSDKPEDIYGNDGEYFAMDDGQSGQNHDSSILDYNTPPGHLLDRSIDWQQVWAENQSRIHDGKCQPGLWCQWIIEEQIVGEQVLAWDGGEKFYYYVEWLKYLINHFFEPWGIKLNGEIEWEGEDSSDRGRIIVTDNKVKVQIGKIVYEDAD